MQDLKSIVAEVKVFSFDVDGTVVDSYSYMKDVIEILLLYLGVPPSMLQVVSSDAMDEWYRLESSGAMDSTKMALLLARAASKSGLSLAPAPQEFNELMLEARVKASPTLPCAVRLLKELKRLGKVVASVSAGDGMPGMKRRRLELSGLARLFDEIVVVPEDSPSRVEALAALASKYKAEYSEVIHVDDRVEVANSVAEAGFRAAVVKTGMYNPAAPREGVLVLENLCVLYEALTAGQGARASP